MHKFLTIMNKDMGYDNSFEKWQDNLPPEKLTESYNKIGWDGWRGMLRDDLLSLAEMFNRSKILDVGCFSGDYLQVLFDKNLQFDYTGIDVTPRYIEYAKKRFSKAKLSNDKQKFKFEEGNIFGLNYPDKSFNVIVCLAVIMHLPKIDKALDEIFRVSSDYLLLGVDIHDGPEEEISQVKNGFLYKTYSKDFIFRKINERGEIIKVSSIPSPDYNYEHYSIIAKIQPKSTESNKQ